MRFLELAFLGATLLSEYCNAAPWSMSYVLHEKRHVTSPAWVKRSRVAAADILPMRVGLVQTNLEKGHDLLMDISDPASPNYAKHWTSEEVINMFRPSEETVSAVAKWLIASGISKERLTHTDNKAWFAFNATVQEAEDLLKTEYFVYENSVLGHTTVACDEYHAPAHIQQHIDYITPGIRLVDSLERRRIKRNTPNQDARRAASNIHEFGGQINELGNLSTCDTVITPACIAALYQVPPGDKAHPLNAMGIYEFGDDYGNTSLDLFFATFAPHIPQGTRPTEADIDFTDSATVQHQESGEADTDFDVAYPLVYPQTLTIFQTDDPYYSEYWANEYRGLFNDFLDGIDGSYCVYSAFGETGNDPIIDPIYPDNHSICPYCGTTNDYTGPLQCGVYKPTNVISISYGSSENNYPAYYQKRQCNEFLKLGLQGVSIFVASGDRGVADNAVCLGPDAKIFGPGYPSNCPYVTSVGATQILLGNTISEPEVAVVPLYAAYPFNGSNYVYTSEGGFSNIYTRPTYQERAISSFFENHDPPYPYYIGNDSFGANGGLYNRIGRGYPDVSANGVNTAIYIHNTFNLSGGTSASAPMFAGIINRVNEERLAIGKKTVGFINPALYANPWVLNDITDGHNVGCGTQGFNATKGSSYISSDSVSIVSTSTPSPSFQVRNLRLFLRYEYLYKPRRGGTARDRDYSADIELEIDLVCSTLAGRALAAKNTGRSPQIWSALATTIPHLLPSTDHVSEGDVVRIAPNDLSFATLSSSKEIYNHSGKGHRLFLKSAFYDRADQELSIVMVRDPLLHSQKRRGLAHAFSAKALREQEGIVLRYVEMWLKQLGERAKQGETVNIVEWYNWLTFDIIGDLAFGEPFGAVEEGQCYPCSCYLPSPSLNGVGNGPWNIARPNFWISLIGESTFAGSLQDMNRRLPLMKLITPWIIPNDVPAMRKKHFMLSLEKTRKRMKADNTREDFFKHILSEKISNITEAKVLADAQTLIVAGSETTATFLSGVTFHLLHNLSILEKLNDEIRTTFASSSEITGDSTAHLPYLHAVIEEGLRIYPPVSFGLPRVSPGATVDGHYVPQGTTVSTSIYTLARDPRYWTAPERFIPERWLPGSGYTDAKEASKPFSIGPRACIGINLAYLEMRIILAKMVWQFDLQIGRDFDWEEENQFHLLWKKPELEVKFTPALRKP
ncbi:hypothetical protein MMC17_009701 [Xylographa soralifera]|nr:hypothetical protein [Xylographa soralifera]